MKLLSSSISLLAWIRLPLVVLLILHIENYEVDSFVLTTPPRQPRHDITVTTPMKERRSMVVKMASSEWNDNVEDDDDEEELDFMSSSSPEKSRMTDFIASFLKKSGQQAKSSEAATGDDSSIIQNPDTCTHLIAMPLDSCHELMLELESVQRGILYHCPVLVHACIQQAITKLPLLYVRTSGPSATSKLFSIVEDVIEDHLLQPVEGDQEVEDGDMLNEDGTRPFTMQFTSLEIDGPKNEILQAVASVTDSDKLRVIVEDLQNRIHKETSWQTMLPPDPQAEVFRARIPFMRLPDNWDDYLERPPGTEDDDFVFLPSDQGGNGISPIFWGKWIDDDFGTARMREVGVFKRTSQTKGLNEKAFYLPEKYLKLPEGTRAMSKQEAYYRDYQEQRMLEAEGVQADEAAGETPEQSTLSDDDKLLQMTRDRLEKLYAEGASSNSTTIDNSETDVFDSVKTGLVDKPIDPTELDDWTRDRIENIVASRAKVQSEKELLHKSKDKPPVEENEVFKKFKDGSLAPKQVAPRPAPELPPFPSRQHCVGFWKVLQSPTGFEVEETDSSRSDNLVLRVDGTTAGGPILDQTSRQKAAGGTWRLKDDDLRIRLIIPPGKERILVMQGKVELVSAKSNFQLASNTFGIPELEARQARSATELDDVIYCKGEVWVEDAVTKLNRWDVGSFSLMKLDTPSDQKEFTITIPQPIRNQD